MNCLAYVLVNAISPCNDDPKYGSYRDAYWLKKPVEELLKASGVDLSNGGVLQNFNNFNKSFRTTKLLSLMVWNQIDFLLKQIQTRLKNCIYCTIRTLGIRM
jgi:hypothetical protein